VADSHTDAYDGLVDSSVNGNPVMPLTLPVRRIGQ